MHCRPLIIICLIFTLFSKDSFAAQDLSYFLKYADSSTNRLVQDKRFKAMTERFFGKLKDAYLTSKMQPSGNTLLSALGGPPDNIRIIQQRYLVASACRAQSCDEKGIVMMDMQSGNIAYGLVHYSVDQTGPSETSYAQQGILTMFFHEGVPDEFKDFSYARVKEWQASFRNTPYSNITSLIPATRYIK